MMESGTFNRETFTDKNEYKTAVQNFRKEHPRYKEMISDNLLDYRIGTLFVSIDEDDLYQIYSYKFKEGQPKVIDYDDYALWLENVVTVKIELEKPLITCDFPRQLRIGYLSIEAGIVFTIGIQHLKRSEGAVLTSYDERRYFGEHPWDPTVGTDLQPKTLLPLPEMIDLVS